MSDLLKYFNRDSTGLHIVRTIVPIKYDGKFADPIDIFEIVALEIQGYSRYSSFYIPETKYSWYFCLEVLKSYETFKQYSDKISIIGKSKGDRQIGNPHVTYTNKIYFYLESNLNHAEYNNLDAFAREKGYFVTIRSKEYVEEQLKINKPQAFISHDHNDKQLIALPLANGLKKRLCTVWYDEYSLKVGDSLRESIEQGIRDAQKCILILTPNFLKNPGWGKREFNSIFTREVLFEERIVLPIWFGVSKYEIYNYSPSLADVYALIWPDPSKMPEDDYKKEVEQLISKLHTKITSKRK